MIQYASSYKRLLDLNRRVVTLRADLVQSSKAIERYTPERFNVSSLMGASQRVNGYAAHAMDVLWLYHNMSPADRTKVRSFVGESLRDLAKLTEIDIDELNYVVGDTSKPGLVSAATEFKNAARQIIDELNSIRR
jgi:hypothetical protein